MFAYVCVYQYTRAECNSEKGTGESQGLNPLTPVAHKQLAVCVSDQMP